MVVLSRLRQSLAVLATQTGRLTPPTPPPNSLSANTAFYRALIICTLVLAFKLRIVTYQLALTDMATVSPPRLRIPLSDSTPDINAQPPSPEHHTAKSHLQRTESYRAFHPQLDSSESDFSAQDSLYEAQPYAGDKVSGEEPKEKEKSFEWQHEAPLPAVPSSSSWEWDTSQDPVAPSGDWDAGAAPRRQARIPNPAVHGYNYDSHPQKIISKRIWVLPSLATIHEQRSNSTIRTSLSLPRIPSKRTSINSLSSTGSATPHLSNLSPIALSPSTAPSTPTGAPPTAPHKSRRRKSISLDELTLPSCRAALNAPFCSTSSSSEDDRNPAAHHVDITYPAVPTYPPLTRTPTPPGLPSFGSREALNYSSRHSIATPDPVFDANGETSTSSNAVLAFIERVFSQPTPHSYALSPPRSIALPPGVIAQAADGTMVRGRFGVRQSAHMGMSGGTIALERHPFHRDAVPLARVTARTSFDGAGQDRQPRVVRFSEEVEVAEGMCGSIGRKGKKKAWGRRRKGKNVAASQAQGDASSNHNQAAVTAEASGAITSTRRNGFLAFPPHSILRRTITPPWQDLEQGPRQDQDQDQATARAEPAQGQDTVELARAVEAEAEPSRRAKAKGKAKELLKTFWRNIVSSFLYGESAKTHADRGCGGNRPDTRSRRWKRWLSCGGYCC
jgi:hypothetical protein